MERTKIEWCDSTWNPVTGCLNGCEYCYAGRIAERFAGYESGVYSVNISKPGGDYIFDISEENPPVNIRIDKMTNNRVLSTAPYPFGFSPTFHRSKLRQLGRWKKPKTIFVCSMADLFGEWIPDEWIEEIFTVCKENPQHTYLFLTKNPARYIELAKKGLLPADNNMWYGTTATTPYDPYFFASDYNTFLSIEPIMADYTGYCQEQITDWVIIGAETGKREGKVKPERSWIEAIRTECEIKGTPVFMKDSLAGIVGEENMVRQFPFPESDPEKSE